MIEEYSSCSCVVELNGGSVFRISHERATGKFVSQELLYTVPSVRLRIVRVERWGARFN